MKSNRPGVRASYFGLNVGVICGMENYSLICFEGRQVVVETADLVFLACLRPQAANSSNWVRKSKRSVSCAAA